MLDTKYRIQSYELPTQPDYTVFTILDMDAQEELRISAQALLATPQMLYAFSKADIVRIVYLAACEQAADAYRKAQSLQEKK